MKETHLKHTATEFTSLDRISLSYNLKARNPKPYSALQVTVILTYMNCTLAVTRLALVKYPYTNPYRNLVASLRKCPYSHSETLIEILIVPPAVGALREL